MSHPLDGTFRRLNRADRHLADAQDLVNQWEQDCTETVISDNQGKAWFPNGFPPIDEGLPLLVSDAVHNLRAALDYVVFELALHDSGKLQHGTHFIVDDAEWDPADPTRGFNGRAKRCLKGLTPAHVRAIETFQPYKGTDWAKTLVRISNIDKHRQLVVVTHRGRRVDVGLKHGATGKFLTGAFHMTADGPVPERVDLEFHGDQTIAIAVSETQAVALIPTLRAIQFGVKRWLSCSSLTSRCDFGSRRTGHPISTVAHDAASGSV